MNELKPCPFCGGKAELISGFSIHPVIDKNGAYVDADIDDSGMSYVLCTQCHASSAEVDIDDENKAINAWNRRADNATD